MVRRGGRPAVTPFPDWTVMASEKRSALRTAALAAAVPLVITAALAISRLPSSAGPVSDTADPRPAARTSSGVPPTHRTKPTPTVRTSTSTGADAGLTLPPSAPKHQREAYDRAVKAEQKRDQARDHAVEVAAAFPLPSASPTVTGSAPPPDAYISPDGQVVTEPPTEDVAPPAPDPVVVPAPVSQAIADYQDKQGAATSACDGAAKEGIPIGPIKIAPHLNPLCTDKDKKVPPAILRWLPFLGLSPDDFK
jgi:hypothetical protein